MQNFPFTLEEAIDICEDFEDLIDTDYNLTKSQVYVIQNVVTCPFNDIDRRSFIENYYRTKDREEALYFYKGNEFDVIVFACDPDNEAKYIVMDIRTYTSTQGINYHFPGQARVEHDS